MQSGVILDTSFLINLVSPKQPRHSVAKQYYEYFIVQGMPMALSSVVISEFEIKQSIASLPLENFVMLPFNYDDAKAAAELNFARFKEAAKDRASLKDDFKILGQAKAGKYGFIITDDTAFNGHCINLLRDGFMTTKSIFLQDGFHLRHFDPTGQDQFGF